MKKAIISTALVALTVLGVASAGTAHADGTTPPPWDFYGVPQLGREAVRGTGCGGYGSIGDVIPDGYWRGYLGSEDGTSIEFDLACVYINQVANSTPVPDGWLVNNKTRTRTVAKSPGFFITGTRYLPDGSVPFAQTATVEQGGMYDGDNIPFEGGDSWLFIDDGQAQWLVGSPVAGAPVAINPAPVPAFDPALIAPGVIEDGVHFGYAVNATPTSISFDRADVQPDGLWTNNNPRVRTLPVAPGFWAAGNLFPYPGQPIEIHIQGQRVTMLTDAMPYDDHCGC